jgi:mevalonate kinase
MPGSERVSVADLAAGVSLVKRQLDKVDDDIRQQLLIAADLDSQYALQLAGKQKLQQEIADAQAELAAVTISHSRLGTLLLEKERHAEEEAAEATQMDVRRSQLDA